MSVTTALHAEMMAKALTLAHQAKEAGEVPVGAVVYKEDGTILGQAHNEVLIRKDATAHAEFLACQQALEKDEEPYLTEAHVAVTLEPCAMCAQALSWWRVRSIRFGAYDVKSGGLIHGARVLEHAHHKPEVYGGMEEERCTALLQSFFKERRA